MGVIVLGNCLLFGQSFSGTISGIVRDSSEAVIPQATITVRNTETGQTRATESGASGGYSLPLLPVGPYELTVEKAGFRKQVRRGITLSVAQEAVLNLTLEVGDVQQIVEVTGETPLVNATLAATSGLITGEQLRNLPINGRSFHQLMTLNTHTVDNRSNSGGASFSIAGKRTENNRWTINGVDYVGDNATGQQIAPNGISGQLLGVEAVREFNVLGHTYGAEYGKRSGGQITVVTASGTNQLHGAAFEYLRNNKLDARNFFDFEDADGDGQADNAPFKRNQFGGSLGGPLLRDKMFIFGNYEGFRERLGVSSNVFVPSAQARQGLLPCYIANPAAGCPDPRAYVPVPSLQPGILPYAQLFWPEPDPGSEQLVNQVVGGRLLTDLPTGIARSTGNPVERTEEDFGLLRFDFNMSSADSLSANFTADEGRLSEPEGNTNFRGTDTRDLYTLSVQETHIFSPTVLNVATFGASRAGATASSVSVVPIPENLVFLRSETRKSPGAFTIGAAGGGSAALVPANPNNPFYNNRQFYSGSDDLRITRGRHNLSLGVWFQRVQQTAFSAAQLNSGSAQYDSLLDFLRDQPIQFVFASDPTELNFRSKQFAWYFQDTLKLRPNLTVRLGLRHEMTNGWNEKNGNASNYLYDPNGVILTQPRLGASTFVENNALALLQPRVGVAWDPTGAGKWAVRAGFGIHHDLQDNLAQRLNVNPPFAGRVTIENTPLLSIIPIAGGAAPPSCSAESPLRPPACVLYSPGGIEPTMHTPTVQEWSLTVERELARDFLIQVGYVGSQSFHVTTTLDMNTIRPVKCENPRGCLSGGVRPARLRVTVPQGTEYIPAGVNRPNPFVGSTLSWFYPGTASHHGGSLSLLKRSRGGLLFKTNYTFSKVTDLHSAILGNSAQNAPASVLNRYNLKLSRGVAAYSLQHVMKASFSYPLPFGRGQALGSGASGLLDKLIGGWQWNGVLSAQSGFPITPQAGSNQSGNGDVRNPDVPNRNPNFSGEVILGEDGFKKTGRYFDPNAFLLPPTGTFGNVSRGAFRGPGLVNLDTSLFKRISLKETWSLQFRAEFFNILNHANFDTPNPLVFTGTNVNASAGVITETAARERQIQFALKLEF